MSKQTPQKIPRSGDAADKVDGITLRLHIGDNDYLINRREGDFLIASLWMGRPECYQGEHWISLYEAMQAQPEIWHYFGKSDLKWTSWEAFSFDQSTKRAYVKVRFLRFTQRVTRGLRAKRKLVTAERFTTLKGVWAMQVAKEREPGKTQIAMHIYGKDVLLHPGYPSVQHRLGLILDSLVESGELRASQMTYRTTGKGLAYLEQYEEQERKHGEARWIQWGMLALTGLLFFSAVVQADLVELPPLLKISKWFWQ